MPRFSPALCLWRPLSERTSPAAAFVTRTAISRPSLTSFLSVFIFQASQQIPAHLSLPVLSYNSILALEKRNIFATKVFTWKQQQWQ
jgi:hypothetical protein